jgi:hypothetical protein
MYKYLFLAAVLVLTFGGTLSLAVRDARPDGAAGAEAAVGEDTLAAQIKADTLVTASYLGEVAFPHRYHVEDEEIPCADCHHETNAASLHLPDGHEGYFEDFWIDCSVCHHDDGEAVLAPQACSECHPANPRDEADETLSAKVVIHKNCEDCHDFGTGAEAFTNCQYCHTGAKKSFRVGQ